MAGYFSRNMYDQCDYTTRNMISEGVGNYKTTVDQLNSDKLCLSGISSNSSRTSYLNIKDISNAGIITDIESNLLNIDTPWSNCMSEQTIVDKNNRLNGIAKDYTNINVNCDNNLNSFNSRLDISKLDFREKTFSRFDFPLVPHTSYYFNGFEYDKQIGNNRSGFNTRLMAKDNLAK